MEGEGSITSFLKWSYKKGEKAYQEIMRYSVEELRCGDTEAHIKEGKTD